ncbi:MAG: DUF4395 domain-containing protein [Sporolactobacillus sp.]|jgi:hypothetical protein|nr:DUF4395 domain-containing protein [Sporolactobacillus sp.]
MADHPVFIPRPLVRTNQWVIVLSVVLTWFTGSWLWLLIPLLSGLSGLLFHFNPVMAVAKRFLKKRPSDYIPEDPAQQRFNQTLSVSLLSLGLIGYLLHWKMAALIFTALVATAAFVAILGFCIGCFIHYHWSQYRQKRKAQAGS